ncbi:hypothetical protein [Methylobacterium sp. 174MFSha1.1]|uniref:hypothetical protein n=1 Tax=Methylobacterium sp. 174MFSha1.1 TaxID=1502749 RepID=UPI0011602CFE|nr:hypothetical protein [Methylobacterium sp. 174MFSha1.1]
MRELTDILSELASHQARLMTEAFEAGRAAGRVEATADILHKIGTILPTGPVVAPMLPIASEAKGEAARPIAPPPAFGGGEDTGRATPGSVKPRVAQLVSERPGITTRQIEDATGFKLNSIRGTLWALHAQDHVIERRNGGWYPSAQKDEAAGANPEERTPTASDDEDLDGLI